jgi:hypothetical protein
MPVPLSTDSLLFAAKVAMFRSSFCWRGSVGGLVLLAAGTVSEAGTVRSPESWGLQFGSRENVLDIPGRMISVLMISALVQAEKICARAEASAALLEAAVLAQGHLRRHGKPPTLADLAAAAGRPPLDPFSGDPLRLTLQPDGMLIYSVGINGQDDGGRLHGEGQDCDDLRVFIPVRE